MVKHCMTIDVEEHFQVAALASAIQVEDWPNQASRVERNTHKIMDLFARHGVSGTFFVLGWVAERYPQLVKDIAAAGHEIASHGYSHQLIYSQTQEVFRQETERSKKLLEDISGKAVDGYRAASYSITKKSLWALDILAELGFTWDSSIFPIVHDRYGIPGSPTQPYTIETKNGGKLTEIPLTTARLGPLIMPAAGGGYFRQYPYWLSKAFFARAAKSNASPQMFYLHPWEIDPEQPRVQEISWFSRFRHYTNLARCEQRLDRMLKDFEWDTVAHNIEAYNKAKDIVISTDGFKIVN